MPQVDITKTGAETAAKLGLSEEAADKKTGPAPKEEPQPTEETVETEEAEETEEAAEPSPGKKPETIPLHRFNEVYGRMKELERTLLEIAKSPRQTEKPAAPPPPDWDAMTNAEMASYIISAVNQIVPDVVNRAVTPMASTVEQERVSRDIQTTASKYPDFWDYREKMVEIANRHPTLTAEEAYYLASGNTGAAKKAVVQRVKAQIDQKKAARTEQRSSPAAKVSENKEYKTVREAGLAAARKLGLM